MLLIAIQGGCILGGRRQTRFGKALAPSGVASAGILSAGMTSCLLPAVEISSLQPNNCPARKPNQIQHPSPPCPHKYTETTHTSPLSLAESDFSGKWGESLWELG